MGYHTLDDLQKVIDLMHRRMTHIMLNRGVLAQPEIDNILSDIKSLARQIAHE
jgi:aspartate ammonia-lyase